MPSSNPSSQPLQLEYDVLICGAGLAGLTLALQIRQEHAALRVALVERSTRPLPEACHKVGESSVELGSQYLERLGLRQYLESHHIIKLGLRFFPGGGHLPLHQRTELGPSQEPRVRSYQIDRGRFENDLRALVVERGVELLEGSRVSEVQLGSAGEAHQVAVDPIAGARGEGKRQWLKSRWLLDATGRDALLRRRLGLQRSTEHAANAAWFRVAGRLDVGDLVPRTEETFAWHALPLADQRWRSTNHLMGRGYWVWLIPLASGNTSVGVVTHDEHHDFNQIRTRERAVAFLEKHEPVVAQALSTRRVLDFRCLHGYSHDIEHSWSADRWGVVGEAGAFVDPLYSPGTDFIALANSMSSELLRADLAGEDLQRRTDELNTQYQGLVAGALQIFRGMGDVYGNPKVMTAKIYWDNFAYWTLLCQYFQQRLYRVSGDELARLARLHVRFAELAVYMQRMFRNWARRSDAEPTAEFIGIPRFPSLAVEAHVDLERRMTPSETLAYLTDRLAQSEEMARELVLRVLVELGLEQGRSLLADVDFKSWQLGFSPQRLEQEGLVGMARRRGLPGIARDVERSLGRANRHPSWREALELLPIDESSAQRPPPPPRSAAALLAQF